MRDRATRIALLLLVALALVGAVDNFDRALANPDEGRYSEIAREMAESGDWITPRLNGLKYFEKPPLQYWATAASFRLFGTGEFAARAYTTACGLAVLLLVAFTARRLGTPEHALAAAMVLAASPYFVAMGAAVTLDMGLTLWTTLTFCAYLLAEHPSTGPRGRKRWLLVAWAAMALAVLSKGLVGIVFPAAAIVLHAFWAGGWRRLLALEWGWGSALFFAIAAPWFVVVSLENPEFARFFFIHEHFERFLTTSHHRVEPWWYFIPIFILGFLPWMFAIPGAIAHALESERGLRGFRPLTFALLWSAFVVAFFSASGSKLPMYVLPAFPAFALVLGRYLAEAPTRRLAVLAFPVMLVAIGLAFLAWRAPLVASEEWLRALRLEAQPFGYLASATVFLTAIAGGWLLLRGRRMLAIVGIALGTLVAMKFIEDAFDRFTPRQSGRAAAEKMRPWLTPATRVYSVKHYDYTISFYTGRTATLVEYVDEFSPGLRSEPHKAIARLDDFAAAWLRPGDAVAIMQREVLEDLEALGLPMQVLHSDPRRVIVRKP
jgi:4-amino-4-deoxy-L-arabinose transferase-like glycosyltransferase